MTDVQPPYAYPYATAPDIIRSHQKDAYYTATLTESLSTVLRNVYGARALHNHSTLVRTAADTLYLSLTTLLGNRTLGEEYCDIVHVEGSSARVPRARLRAAFVALHVLLPYLAGRIVPRLRRRLAASLEHSSSPSQGADREEEEKQQHTPIHRLTRACQHYALAHLSTTLTSPAPIYALSLATFYFSGAYYHLSKRLLGLRYTFTRHLDANDQRAGYEVLGVLLLLQLAVQGYLHVQATLRSAADADEVLAPSSPPTTRPATTSAVVDNTEVSLDPNALSSNNALLFPDNNPPNQASTSTATLARITHTPLAPHPRVDLSNAQTMKWLGAAADAAAANSTTGRARAFQQARKCTLCLEPIKDPAATTCGHVFCWGCICEWAREKPECPLCRRGVGVQHVLLLR